MKTAERMFLDLGYRIECSSSTFIEYIKDEDNIITFNSRMKRFCKSTENGEVSYIREEELKAINKQISELGWYI